MRCLHPFCPMGAISPDWASTLQQINMKPAERALLLGHLSTHFNAAPASVPLSLAPPPASGALLKRLLHACPCLYNQLDATPSADAVVHLCELTLQTPITSANVHDAFLVQHPSKGPGYRYPPHRDCPMGGTVMELLCSEVLANAGIPAMALQTGKADGWPIWKMPGHILLNRGRMESLKAFGDILIPCGPNNLIISVKTEAARERLLYSSNSIEGLGFGFFNKPSEFWTPSRMRLYKRMGFTAIYMPDQTCKDVLDHLDAENTSEFGVNVNGTALYRPLSIFESDMLRVVGRSSLLL